MSMSRMDSILTESSTVTHIAAVLVGVLLTTVVALSFRKKTPDSAAVKDATMSTPTEICYKVTIDMPREKAWSIMQDITVPHKYVPGVIRTEMHGEQVRGVGASRRVFKKTMALDETVVEWREGFGFKIRLHDGAKDKPFPQSSFDYALEDGPAEKADSCCIFTATMAYSFPLGVFGSVIDRLLVAPIVKGEIRDVALAVKYFYETNSSPTKADIKSLRQRF